MRGQAKALQHVEERDVVYPVVTFCPIYKQEIVREMFLTLGVFQEAKKKAVCVISGMISAKTVVSGKRIECVV